MSRQLVVVRGDSHEFTFSLTMLDDYGLIGADVWFTVDGLLEKTLGDGIEANDDEDGLVVTIEAGDTDAAPSRRTVYAYDLQVRFADGRVKTPARGSFVVLPDVTVVTEP